MLPGRFIRERRTAAQTVREVLEDKLGVSPAELPPLRLLQVFDDPDRDPRGWTLSIAYSLGLPEDDASTVRGDLLSVDRDGSVERPEQLSYDHADIVREAVARMRERYEAAPDPDGLLRPPVTLSQLRRLHEVVLGEPLRKDTFNRRMREHLAAALEETSAEPLFTSDTVGRPAQMFTYTNPEPEAAPLMPLSLPRVGDARGRPRRPRP